MSHRDTARDIGERFPMLETQRAVHCAIVQVLPVGEDRARLGLLEVLVEHFRELRQLVESSVDILAGDDPRLAE
nr:hypothetical protein [Rhodococcus jostii]